MKPSKLYIRIFLSFLVLLIITEIAIFGFFISFASRKIGDYYKENGQIRFDMTRGMAEFQISKYPVDFTSQSPGFIEFIDHLGVAFKTKIWITDADGVVLYNSFKSEKPMHRVKHWLDEIQKHDSYFRQFSQFDIYKHGPLEVGNGKDYTIHVIFDDRSPFRNIDGFAYGLILIGLIVALMTFPIARRISKPINNLTESTKKLEQGDLSHRTSVNSKDEIGELATAFNKMAGKLENMVKSSKEMTAQVSHELRSPLARIQIAVEILKDKLNDQNGETAEQLKTIQTDVDELDRIIGRILELSKLDLQNDVPYTEVFSPGKILSETVGRYETSFQKKKISIERKIESDAKIIGNKDAFITAFNNLMDNACKYTPTHGKVNFSSIDKGDLIEIQLTNSGALLAENDLVKLFNPFFRIADNGENGAGLGLSITRKIVEKHNGKISASNTESGLAFRIQVPTVRLD